MNATELLITSKTNDQPFSLVSAETKPLNVFFNALALCTNHDL